MRNLKVGDVITFRVSKREGKTESDIIEEVFLSMDKTFQCYWVKGRADLITEFMLVEEEV